MRAFTLLLLVFLSILAAAFPTLIGQQIPKPELFQFPITKHEPDNTYYTSLNVGSSAKSSVNLILDLGTSLSLLNCRKIKSLSSLRLLTCKSSACKSISGTSCAGHACLYKQLNPFAQDPVTGRVVQDRIFFNSTVGPVSVPRFTFVCASQKNLRDLPNSADGVLGLSHVSTSFPNQVTSAFNVIPKFVVCLPSSGSGRLFVGSGPSFPRTLTPLTRTASGGYSLITQSVYVDGIPLSLKPGLLKGGKLSTAAPYTSLHTDIYSALAKSFTQRAKAMGISKVPSVEQFKDCFDSRTIGRNSTGPNVPVIEIGLPGRAGDVRWRFYGASTVVKVNEKVMCLAFMDGGERLEEIHIGAHLIQDYLLEFDLSTTLLGFSDSLLLQNSSCSTWRPQN